MRIPGPVPADFYSILASVTLDPSVVWARSRRFVRRIGINWRLLQISGLAGVFHTGALWTHKRWGRDCPAAGDNPNHQADQKHRNAGHRRHNDDSQIRRVKRSGARGIRSLCFPQACVACQRIESGNWQQDFIATFGALPKTLAGRHGAHSCPKSILVPYQGNAHGIDARSNGFINTSFHLDRRQARHYPSLRLENGSRWTSTSRTAAMFCTSRSLTA